MKVLRRGEDHFDVRLGKEEMRLWIDLLGLYPCVPPAHHQLTKDPGDQKICVGGQSLLDEALAEQRNQQRENLRAFLADPARCHQLANGGRLNLTSADIEWLLQVLNDIRVGSWIRVGSPECGMPEMTKAKARGLWAMELSGFFQMSLLEALESKG